MSVGKRTQVYSPGMILQGKIIVEQVKSQEGYVYAVKKGDTPPYMVPTLDLGEVTYYPMQKCPWPVAMKPVDYGSEDELFKETRKFVYDHIDISINERYYDLLTAWIKADWVQENFLNAPYIHFHGPPASGKTRGLEIIQNLGYRCLLSPSVSPAALYRTIEILKPTFLIDEAELYTSKGIDESKREVLSVLNAGYRRGQVVIRADSKGETLKFFLVFGFKGLASVQSLPATLSGRALRIPMMRATRKIKQRIDEEAAETLRNKLLMYRFNNVLKEPETGINPIDVTDGRLIELFTPLILVTPNKAVEKRLVSLAKDIFSETISEEQSTIEGQVFFTLIDCIIPGESLTAVADVADRYNVDKTKKEQISVSYCGRILKRLGFNKKLITKRRIVGVILNQDLITRLKYRYGYVDQQKLEIKSDEIIDNTVQRQPCSSCRKIPDKLYPDESGFFYICKECKLGEREKEAAT